MRKVFFLASILYFNVVVNAQTHVSTSSEISFFSTAPLEDIHAVNKDAKSLLNTTNNELAVVIGIRSFKFEKELMEEHFNENYLESDKFKTAVFKGKINETIDFSKDGTYDVSATGKLTIHGIEQERTITGTITIKGGKLVLNSKFKVALKDHKIKIPKAVTSNIAEEIEVTTLFNYEPKVQK